jgi:hypothetical protein
MISIISSGHGELKGTGSILEGPSNRNMWECHNVITPLTTEAASETK